MPLKASQNLLKGALANSIVRDTASLMAGSAAGRIILFLALPLISRIYSPEDFRLLAVFLAIISTISVVSCLRLDIAIPLASRKIDAVNLLGLSLTTTLIISLFSATILSVAPNYVVHLIGIPTIRPYLWLVPFGIFLTASYSALQFWATRLHRFGLISKTRIGQAAIGASAMLSLGWLGLAPLGLLLGNMMVQGAGGIRLATNALRTDMRAIKRIRLNRMAATLRTYRRYPIFSAPEALANIATVQVPFLLIAVHLGTEGGQLFLAYQVISAPVILIGHSLGQVYASRAAEELRNRSLGQFTRSMMARLFVVGLIPMALIAGLSPVVFPIVFGDDWNRAGWIATLLVPAVMGQLSVSPLVLGLHICERQGTALLLHLFGAILRVGFVFFGLAFSQDMVIELFAISGVIFYIVYAVTLLKVTSAR